MNNQPSNVPGAIGIPSGAPNNLLSIASYLTQLGGSLNNWIAQAANAINWLLTTPGQAVSSQVPTSAAVAISSGTSKNLTSISLPAGDWDVFGNITYNPSATINYSTTAISTVSATLPDLSLTFFTAANGGSAFTLSGIAPTQRISVSAATTIYLVGFVSLGSGTCTMFGQLFARRFK